MRVERKLRRLRVVRRGRIIDIGEVEGAEILLIAVAEDIDRPRRPCSIDLPFAVLLSDEVPAKDLLGPVGIDLERAPVPATVQRHAEFEVCPLLRLCTPRPVVWRPKDAQKAALDARAEIL